MEFPEDDLMNPPEGHCVLLEDVIFWTLKEKRAVQIGTFLA
jgi:hypothetical protein